MGTIAATDSDLVEASRRGELDAFGHLVARYQDVVCAVSYSSTRDRALSEDVAQETFVAAWRQIDRARPATIRQWLCGIARNLGRKARRKTHREDPLDEDAHAQAAGSTPFDDLARADSERIVREALGRVPDAYREVLVLYYREDESVRDVAKTLGIGEDAVMQRLSRGRRHLADGVTALVERSLREPPSRSRRDLVACVLAAVAALAIPSRVDASPTATKGSTMLKIAAATTALAAAGAAAYFVHARGGDDAPIAAPALARSSSRPLHYGGGAPHTPSLASAAAPRAVAARTVAADDLPYLPADADVVIGVDLAQLRQSAIWQTFVAPSLASNSAIAAVAAQCGFDPIASAQAVSLGLHGFAKDETPAGTIVIHGYDKAKALACASGQQPDGVSVRVADGDVFVDDGHMHLAATFVGDAAIVVVSPNAVAPADLAAVAAGGPGPTSHAGFASLFANVDPTDPVWLVVTDESGVMASVNASLAATTPIRVHGAFGSLGVTDTLAFHGGIHLASGDDAAQVLAAAQAELDTLAAGSGGTARYFDQIDITSDGTDVLVDAALGPMQLAAGAMSGAVQVEVD